ncbi:hypothetical protein SGFS_104440 [Streptomyces graminofaciens]|uniref:Uncharacterized protein n=1 Tax=Streptomyces graminofaciens TaxID=68212 RepID=A0ABN5W0Z8_9ACTN|nr:hypothetical protein SGFS_104440 [Streptomyces graminofaciens]
MSVPVGEPAGHDEQRGEDDRVGVEYPGQRGERGTVEGAAEGGTATFTMNRSRFTTKTPTETIQTVARPKASEFESPTITSGNVAWRV